MVPSHIFHIQIQIWGSSDLAWHFRFGPGPDSPCEAVWHFQFWEVALPGLTASPRAGPAPGSGPLLPKALLLLWLVQKPLPVVTAANSIPAVMGTSLPWCCCGILVPVRDLDGLGSLQLCVARRGKRKGKQSSGNKSWEFRLDLRPSAYAQTPQLPSHAAIIFYSEYRPQK